jgi:prophage regulatory protein
MESSDCVLRLPEVLRMIGLSRSTLYAMVAAGSFPASIQLGPRARGWLRSSVLGWLDERIGRRGASRAPTSTSRPESAATARRQCS